MDSSAPLTRAAPLGHVPPLDGMRGVLILLVLTVHANYFAFESFAVMVDGFFIASGFLITTLLLEEHRRSGRLNGKSFYFRRAFRLLPTLYVVVGVTLIIGVLFATPEMRTKTIEDVIAASTYTYHVVFPVGEEIARSSGPDVRPLIQVWSLSVEEHFYLLTFPLMLIVIRFRAIRTVAGVLLGMWAAIGMARALGYVGPRFAWYQRPDALMIGVASGLLNATMPTELSEKANRFLRQAANASVVALGVVIGIGTTIVPARLYFPVNPLNGAQLRDVKRPGSGGGSDP